MNSLLANSKACNPKKQLFGHWKSHGIIIGLFLGHLITNGHCNLLHYLLQQASSVSFIEQLMISINSA